MPYLNQLRLQRGAEHLWRLGPRAIAEFIAELPGLAWPAVLDRLDEYRRLDPNVLRATGGDRFAPSRPVLVHRQVQA